GARNLELVCLNQLLNELLTNGGVCLTLEVLRHVGAHGGIECSNGVEVTNFASEGVVNSGHGLALDVAKLNANGLGLAALLFIGEVVGPANGLFGGLAGLSVHDVLFHALDGLSGAEYDAVLTAFGHGAVGFGG